MSYYSITTDAGDAALAQYPVTGTQVLFSQLAVGDGNGQAYDPVKTQTSLRNEVWRGSAVVELDPSDAKRVLITATIPAETGGFTIREAGIFSAAGVMLVIAKFPASEKTTPADGATSDYVVRIYVRVDSVSAVSLTVDQSQIQATKKDLADAMLPVTQSLVVHETDQTVHNTTLSCTKSATVYALTGLTATSGTVPVMFKVPTAYAAGDTVTINGTAYTLKTRDNSALTKGAWAAGAIITGTVDVDAKTLTVPPSAPNGSITNLPMLTGVSPDACTADGTVYHMFNATGTLPPSYTSGDNDFYLYVNSTSAPDWVRQLLIDCRTAAIWTRVKNSGTWWAWQKPDAHNADYASGSVALATPGLRNAIIIGKADSIPTGLPDGTVVLRKQS